MITTLMYWANDWHLITNFIAHTIIFIGAFYVAMYNTKLPHWHVTPLWYVGLASVATSISILVQWTLGAEHPLSFWNIGGFTEIALNIAIAAIAFIMLVVTVKRKLKYKL